MNLDSFRKEVGKVWNLACALLLLLGVYAGSEREFVVNRLIRFFLLFRLTVVRQAFPVINEAFFRKK